MHAEMEWVDRANCSGLDPDLFFPEVGETSAVAKRVCATCVVRTNCLAYAIEHKIKQGIWGGQSPKDRRVARVKAAS